MKRVIVFGQSNLTEEATRHSILCNAIERHARSMEFNTTSIGFTRPDASPRTKLMTALSFCPFRWSLLAFKYILQKPHDLVVLPYPSYMDGWLGCTLAKIMKKKVILDAFVPIYDTLITDRGLFSKTSLVAKIIYAYERFLMSMSDTILVDTEDHKEMLEKSYSIPHGKIRPIPVGINETLWKPLPNKKKIKFQVLFWCTFIPPHGANTVAKAAALLQDHYPDITFVVIGTGQQAALFKHEIDSLFLKNLKWIDRFIPLKEIYSHLGRSQCCLGVFGNREKTQRVIPYKAYQTLAAGKPLITAATKAGQKLFTDRENALLVPPNNPQSLAEAIIYLFKNHQQAEAIGRNGRILYEKELSNSIIVQRINNILRRYET